MMMMNHRMSWSFPVIMAMPTTSRPASYRPTSAVPTTPATLIFKGVANTAMTADHLAIEPIFLAYLHGFLAENFALSLEFENVRLNTTLQSSMVGPDPSTYPVAFVVGGLLFSSSARLVTTPEMLAVSVPFVNELISQLQSGAPSGTPFASVTAVTYTSNVT
jgi:hypothetical protein